MMIKMSNYKIEKVLHSGNNYKIYLATRISDNIKVAVKTPLDDYQNALATARLANEFEIGKKFNHKNIVKYIELIKADMMPLLVSEYFEAIRLDDYIPENGLDTEIFLIIARKIIEGLSEIHRNNIIHQFINPDNILINKEKQKVKISDFGRSAYNNYQVKGDINNFKDSIASVSPEQTGRMNRNIDYRTDFYSLGITFYKMLTGKFPFDSDDTLESVHSHIAKKAVAPHQINNSVPSILSEIILKLLAKNADERYQSAEGLKYDLEHFYLHLSEFEANAANLKNFKVAQNDFSGQFKISQKLYGREKELEILHHQFNKVCKGDTVILLVTGYSGIGKSSIVNELQKEITIKDAYFASGKYEHLKRDIAYSAIAHIFNELIKIILSESDNRIRIWRAKLQTALGVNAQVIVDVIPELELIIGKQPPVQKLGSTETQNRFNLVFQNFVAVFDQMAHPLVIFLDDLQWIDLASLDLIKLITAGHLTKSFFFIGAFRSNEVDASHPTTTTMEEIKKTGVDIQYIHLQPLNSDSINNWVADTLNCRLDKTEALSDLIIQKTDGNPFFVKSFLQNLYDEKLIQYKGRGQWHWRLKEIIKTQPTANVTDLMINKISKLSKNSREILTLGACIGIEFDLHTLSIIAAQPRSHIEQALEQVLISGMIAKYETAYRFIHDKVLEAAYSLITEEQKPSKHLEIGRLLLSNTSDGEQGNAVFQVTGHLNKGKNIITDTQDKNKLAELNLKAGKKAKSSAAYQTALNYFTIGAELLDEQSWNTNSRTAFDLHAELAECEYINGNINAAERCFTMILGRAKTAIQKAEIYNIMNLLYYSKADMTKSLESGISGLKSLGVTFPVNEAEKEAELEKEFEKVKSKLEKIGIENLLHLPELTDQTKLTILDLCMNMLPAAYVDGDFDLYSLLILKIVSISLHSGNSPVSAHAYACYGASLVINYEDYDTAYQFGQIGLRLSEKYGNPAIDVKVNHVYALVINHWKNHYKTNYAHFLNVYHKAVQTGDIIYIDYAISNICTTPFFSGSDLDYVHTTCMKYDDKVKSELTKKILQIFIQFILALKGKTHNQLSFSDNNYNEESEIDYFRTTENSIALLGYYVYKLITYYLFENYKEAEKVAHKAKLIIDVLVGSIFPAIFNFYSSLTLAAIYHLNTKEKKINIISIILSNQKQMRRWADSCPENFLHKYYLVEAELARIQEKHLQAMELYDKAIEFAKQHEFMQEEALANELAAKFWLQKNKDKFARLYMTQAYLKYQQWGATAKVNDLEKKHPYLQNFNAAQKSADNFLDKASVIKAMQALSSEIITENLLTKLIQIIMENAGARKGYIVLKSDEELIIAAGFNVDSKENQVLEKEQLKNTELLSEALVRYVIRTGENIILHNASFEGQFINDRYIKTNASKSVLTMPIFYKNKIEGALFLENNLATYVFSDERIKLLNIILSQAAISLENAKLFKDRILAEEKLIEAKQFNEKIIAKSPIGISIYDESGQCFAVNQALADIIGAAKEQVLQQNYTAIESWKRSGLLDLAQKSLAKNAPQRQEINMITSFRKKVVLDCQSVPLRTGKRTSLLLMVTDMTEHRNMQEMMIQSEKMLSVGGLAAGMAHEINNPLAGMMQTADNMSNRLTNINLPANQRAAQAAGASMEAIRVFMESRGIPRMIATISESGRRIAEIVDNMLGFARKSDSSFSTHDMASLLDKTLQLASTDYDLKKRYDFKAIEIVKKYEACLPLVPCEGAKIQQVLLNILSNGAQAMQMAGSEKPTFVLRARFEKDRKTVCIEIEDNGPGMDEETCKRIFEPFFTTKPVGEGTGLGLSVSYFIITENHGGEMSVESALGDGATFIIKLPVKRKKA